MHLYIQIAKASVASFYCFFFFYELHSKKKSYIGSIYTVKFTLFSHYIVRHCNLNLTN